MPDGGSTLEFDRAMARFGKSMQTKDPDLAARYRREALALLRSHTALWLGGTPVQLRRGPTVSLAKIEIACDA